MIQMLWNVVCHSLKKLSLNVPQALATPLLETYKTYQKPKHIHPPTPVCEGS